MPFPERTRHGGFELLLQEGATVSKDGYGLVIINCSYKGNKDYGFPTVGDSIRLSNNLIDFGHISKATFRMNRDDTVTADYEAINLDREYKVQTDACVEGAGTTSSEPIETHPNFYDKIGGDKVAPKNGAIFDEKKKFIGFGVDLANNTTNFSFAGVRTYLSPRNILRGYFHCVASSNPLGLFANVGKTTATGQFGNFNLIPNGFSSAAGSGGFLLTAVNIENVVVKGGSTIIYKVSYELMQGSQPNGWNTTIYDPAS